VKWDRRRRRRRRRIIGMSPLSTLTGVQIAQWDRA
jgi:hypothetical protein